MSKISYFLFDHKRDKIFVVYTIQIDYNDRVIGDGVRH